VAASAGIVEGELVRSVQGEAVATWQELRWRALKLALEKESLRLETINERGEIAERRIDLSALDTRDLESDLLQQLGLRPLRPNLPAVVGKVSAGGAAEKAGLLPGDRIVAAGGKPVGGWSELVAAVRDAPGRALELEWERGGQKMRQAVVPAEEMEHGKAIGRIGVGVHDDGSARQRLMTTVRYDPFTALGKAAVQTWDTAVFSLSILGRMITGDVSWKNLSGPVTIADYAGQSARLGPTHYLRFLALISISLGVLNLLPIPVLDGGHLMYYIVEIIKGGPVSEKVMEIGQQIGLGLLVLLMAFAFYNDINRLISG
jgi:regulator of sigma E protease